MYIVMGLIAFSILVIVHELGHFALAKLNGVFVEEFSVGMGPKIFGIKGKETLYSLRAFPIGGFCKMLGEEGENTDPRSFSTKSGPRKLSIVAAGPIMNIILAVVLFALVYGITGYPINVIKEVVKDSPAMQAGIVPGDKVIKINSNEINSWDDMSNSISSSEGENLNITIKRGNDIKNITLSPEKKEGKFIIGILPDYAKPKLIEAINKGFAYTGTVINETFKFFGVLFKGKASKNDFGGPISIIKLTGTMAKAGIVNLTWFTAFISVQLAIFNIFPFPALDGGYIVLYIFESITKKKVNQDVVGKINYVGIVLLMTLMVVVTIKDILYPINF